MAEPGVVYRVLRNPVAWPLLYVAVLVSWPLAAATGVRIPKSLDALLGSGSTYTLIWLAFVSPVLAFAGWRLQKGAAWLRFWGNYLRLMADILLAAWFSAGTYLLFTQSFASGLQFSVAVVIAAINVYVLWMVLAGILWIMEDTPAVRAEVLRR